MRWLVFPALAGFAGAVGTIPAMPLSENPQVWWTFAIFGGLLGGIALAASLTSRVWAVAPLAPLVAFLSCATAMTLPSNFKGSASSPWQQAKWLLDSREALVYIVGMGCIVGCGHALSLRWRGASWIRVAGLYGAAAVLSTILVPLGDPGNAPPYRLAILFLSVLAQAPAFLAARTVARRLRPPEAA